MKNKIDKNWPPFPWSTQDWLNYFTQLEQQREKELRQSERLHKIVGVLALAMLAVEVLTVLIKQWRK